jgi:isopentenyl phosphate kinase
VQKLNQAIVSAFLKEDLAAVGISPCFGVPGMQAHGGDDASKQHLIQAVQATVEAGIIPILHGDACLYGKRRAGILSGDTIMQILGQADFVSQAIFLTDVDGVFTADPKSDASATLIRTLQVDTRTGELASSDLFDASGSTHDHDVTGGLKVN